MQLEGFRILLAEDDPRARLDTVRMLEGLGALVDVAEDGNAALLRLGQERYDALLACVGARAASRDFIGLVAAGREESPSMALIAIAGQEWPGFPVGDGQGEPDGVITRPILSSEKLVADILSAIDRRRRPAGDGAEAPEIDRLAYDGLAAAVGQAAFGELLSKVDADITDAYDRMSRAIHELDMNELRAATHILMAVAGAIGAVGLQEMAQRLNRAAHETDEPAIQSVGASAIDEGRRVLAFVRAEYKG